jgi:hypothetical protein
LIDRLADWIGLDWIGLDWIGLDWIGLDWIGLDWIGLDWIGLDWIGLDWISEKSYRSELLLCMTTLHTYIQALLSVLVTIETRRIVRADMIELQLLVRAPNSTSNPVLRCLEPGTPETDYQDSDMEFFDEPSEEYVQQVMALKGLNDLDWVVDCC